MRTNPNDPVDAFIKDRHEWVNGSSPLNKREYFAAMAMQGIQAANFNDHQNEVMTPKEVAELSVRQADRLIEALNKDKE